MLGPAKAWAVELGWGRATYDLCLLCICEAFIRIRWQVWGGSGLEGARLDSYYFLIVRWGSVAVAVTPQCGNFFHCRCSVAAKAIEEKEVVAGWTASWSLAIVPPLRRSLIFRPVMSMHHPFSVREAWPRIFSPIITWHLLAFRHLQMAQDCRGRTEAKPWLISAFTTVVAPWPYF